MNYTNNVDQLKDYAYGEDETGEWIEGALNFDARLISAAPELTEIAEELFPRVLKFIEDKDWIQNTDTALSKPRLKYAFKTVLFNLYLAFLMKVPVRYSRSKEYYARSRRYGQLHYKYQRIIAIVRALKSLRLIGMKLGFRNRGNDHRRQSRMWASGRLVTLFKKAANGLPLQVFQGDLEETVVLKNSKKKAIGYTDSRSTVSMRRNLNKYNEFITGQQVKVSSDGNREISLHCLCHEMWASLLKGRATVSSLQLTDNNDTNITSNNTISNNTIFNYDINNYSSVSITRSFFTSRFEYNVRNLSAKQTISNYNIHPYFLFILSNSIHDALLIINKQPNALKGEVALKNFNINLFEFIINSKKLHRVFNNESFELGGRFYGALYQTMPKEFRKDILINGEPTVELDYSAHHVRIPYHLEGIDYKDDPYLALTDDPEERFLFKKLLLIAINAETESEFTKGFREAFRATSRQTKLSLTNASILSLLQRVKETHNQIAGYINSGAGCKFQNLDSRITEAILVRMTDMGIPCLPVHDSYIVPKQHEDRLRDVMVGEYKAVLGFEPVIK